MTWQRYLIAFVITAAIFGTAFYIASRIDDARVADIRSTEENISIDILSSETQFELLGNLDCRNALAKLGPHATSSIRLQVSSRWRRTTSVRDNPEVIQLKEQYSLFEIKDYLLLQSISQKCGTKPVYILYFYSNAGDCTECAQAGDVLTYLRETYPGLRVYSFDYNLDLSALKTLESASQRRGKCAEPTPRFCHQQSRAGVRL